MSSESFSLTHDQQLIVQAIFQGSASNLTDLASPSVVWANVLQLFKDLDGTVIRNENRIHVSIQNHVGLFICLDQQASLNRRQLLYLCDYLRVVGVDPFDV